MINIDVLGESLHMAMDKAFELQDYEVRTIECEVSRLTKSGLDLALEMVGNRHESGLKSDLLAAFAGGDKIEIGFQQKRAHEVARRGLYITAARRAVTIENGKRIRKRS